MAALDFPNSPSAGDVFSQNGVSYTYDGSVWKRIPVALAFSNLVNKTGAYSIVQTDTGKLITNNNNFTINTSTNFSAGDAVSIHNKSDSTIGISTDTGVMLRFGGSTLTGDRFISPRGLATIVCLSTNVYIIAGAGVT